MFDLLIKGGLVVDGTLAEPVVQDVAVCDGRIVAVGQISGAAKDTVDATGCWVTPGFVDIHTHMDGQATWDPDFTPLVYHGVTTLVMGNCGVGFAPVRPGQQHKLIELMEGVEDIPGVALAEGVQWSWESFTDFMDALAHTPRAMDYLVQVPHDPLRMYVMGERAVAQEAATEADIGQMTALLREALQAGAVGFSTGRSDNHRTALGEETPASEATGAELRGLASAFKELEHGVIQVVSDFDVLKGPARFDDEFQLVEDMAQTSGRPLSMTWLQRDPGGEQYLAIAQRVEAAVARGLPLHLQTAVRGIGVIQGLDASFHPFMGFSAYLEVAQLPLAERAAALREPARKAAILNGKSQRMSGDGTAIPPLVDILLAQIERISARMFPLTSDMNYEPAVTDSFYVRAKQAGTSALEAMYDHLSAGDGSALIYFPIFNYNQGNLDVVRSMLDHPRALYGLSDSGAHVGTVCDTSFSSFMLKHWVLDRAHNRLPLNQAVHMMSARNARYLGLQDRGEIRVGQRADINVINPKTLKLGAAELHRDLPGGGKRFVQKADGYVGTWVAGERTCEGGALTGNRPGGLVRMGQGHLAEH
jgi:N-acyl-D-aspartate/D-glutamate deacylase